MNPALPRASLITPAAASRGSSVASTERGAPATTAPATIAFALAIARSASAAMASGVALVRSNGTSRTLPVAQNSSCPTV